jgi:Cu2+-exporting ATPase
MKVCTHINIGSSAAEGATINWGASVAGARFGASESWIPEEISETLEDLQSRIASSETIMAFVVVMKRETRPWLKQHAFVNVGIAQENDAGDSRSYARFDAVAQTFAQRWIDPIFGQTRDQQRAALSATQEAPTISPAEKEVNRRLLIGVGAFACALTGELLFPPLLIPAVVGGVYASLPLYIQAFRSLIRRKKVTLPVIAGLNLIGTWAGGFITAGTLGLTIFMLAQKLVSKTEDNSRHRLVDVFGQQPRKVWLLVDGVEVEAPFEQIHAGDTLVVQAGQAIPADGVITHGAATIDQHALTGEAQPVEKGVGETVLATTVVLTGAIQVRVEKAGCETTAAQITEILNRTSSYEMEIESKALQFANRTALPTLIVSGIAWPVVGFEGAVAVLAANLGVNVKLTGPITMLNYLNITSRHRVLVKDGRSLELLKEVDTIVFDKTGTLTLEDLHLANVHVFNGYAEDELLALAGAAEQRQSHPIARAIKTAAHARGLPLAAIAEAAYQVGFGIQVVVEGQTIRVGSARYMEMEQIGLSAAMRDLQAACAGQGSSLVWVAVGDQISGALELHATPRPEAKQAIARLRQRDLRLYILSGDQAEPTRKLAEELGIENTIANTLPEGKAAVIAQLQAEGRRVCFVGDGINDAIALKKANVSISMQGATTVAVDTAQIVLMDQDLHHVANLLEIAQDFDATLRRGYAAALIPDAILIGGVFLLHFGIYTSIALGTLGLAAGLGNAMLPLLKYRDGNALPERSAA